MSNDLKDRLIAALEAENNTLRARVADMEAMLGISAAAPLAFGLTWHEARLFGFLLNRELLTKDAAMTVLYGNMPDADSVPEIKIVDVFICKLRAKLKRFALGIETKHGQGHWMTQQMKARARAVLAQAGEPREDVA